MQCVAKMRINILEEVACEWNSAGISYGVLHGLERYPEDIGRDVDVLVDRNDKDIAIELALRVFERNGWIPTIHRKPWAVWITSFYRLGQDVYSAELDVLWDMRWGWGSILDGVGPNLVERGPFKVDIWGSFAKSVLMRFLGGDVLTCRKRWQEFTRFVQDMSVVKQKLLELTGDEGLTNPNLWNSETYARRVRRVILWRALKKAPIRSATGILNWSRDELALRIFQKRVAPIVAVVGPDSVARTALIYSLKRLVESDLTFTQVVVKHWRPGLLPSLKYLQGKRMSLLSKKRPGWTHFVRLLYYSVDFSLGFLVKDRYTSATLGLILYNRWFLDALVNPARYGFSSSFGLKIISHIIPRPDRVVLVYDHIENMHDRKHSNPDIESQLKKWLELAGKGEVDAILRLDAPPEEIVRRLRDLLIDTFIEMNREYAVNFWAKRE